MKNIIYGFLVYVIGTLITVYVDKVLYASAGVDRLPFHLNGIHVFMWMTLGAAIAYFVIHRSELQRRSSDSPQIRHPTNTAS
jgi:hypothetical protein